MGPSTLKSILDSLVSSASATVLSRSADGWDRGGSEFGGELRALAAALVGYGLSPGDRVAVLGSEGRDVLCAELAVLAAGATLVSLNPALSDSELSDALGTTAATQAIASDEFQLGRILALRPDLPALDLVLLMRARPSERKPAALMASAAIEVGRAALAAEPELLRGTAAREESPDAIIAFDARAPSRTTTRRALVALAERLTRELGIAEGRSIVSALHRGSAERMAVALAATALHATLLLVPPGERPDAGLDERPASVVLLSPEALRSLYEAWVRDIEGCSWFRRAIIRWALRQGGDPVRAAWKRGLAEKVALRDLRGKLGGKAVRLDVAKSGLQTRAPEMESFFEALGLPVRYLDVESSGPLAR